MVVLFQNPQIKVGELNGLRNLMKLQDFILNLKNVKLRSLETITSRFVKDVA